MNGRVYDYRLGRFLSVDPIISNPANSQSINPYSHIGNNPLSGVGPDCQGAPEPAALPGVRGLAGVPDRWQLRRRVLSRRDPPPSPYSDVAVTAGARSYACYTEPGLLGPSSRYRRAAQTWPTGHERV